MIKIAKRHNIIYIIQFMIWSYLRVLIKMLLSFFYDFSISSLFTIIMFFGEFTSGLIVYKYQSKFLRKNEIENIALIEAMKRKNTHYSKYQKQTNKLKVFSLLFLAAFLDFVEYILASFYIIKYTTISSSLDSRCFSFLVICNSLTYKYLLKFKIYKHQKFSLLIIFSCLILTIGSEYGFQKVDVLFTYGDFTIALFLILLEYFFLAMMDTIDKYLLEFENVDPFLIIMTEGGIGIFLGIIFCFVENPIDGLKAVHNSCSSPTSFGLFIFLLFLFYACGCIRAPFRIMINKFYSPMVLTLSDYLLNPIYLLFKFLLGDFKSKNDLNVLYFITNFFLSSLTLLSTFIFNEFIVLFCWGLEHNTHDQISLRSNTEVELNLFDIKIENEKERKEKEETDEDIDNEEIEI